MSRLCFLTALGLILICCLTSCKNEEKSTKNTAAPTSKAIAAKDLAPSFTLVDLSGKSHSLEEYKGKLVLINFWATWCAPCVAEMPAFERLYKQLKDKNFEIIAIAVEPKTNIQSVKDFVEKNGLSFQILIDSDMVIPPLYGVAGFPETFFVDPHGRFVSLFNSGAKMNKVRIIGDRPWDSPAFIENVTALLARVFS